MQIYLFEVSAAVDDVGNVETFYFSNSRGFDPVDIAAYFEPVLLQPALFRAALADDLRTNGASDVSYGEVLIANDDGAFDEMLNYGYGRSARLLRGDDSGPYSDFQVLITGTVEQPAAPQLNQISFRFRDRQEELQQPYQPSYFAGTNDGPTGLEGTADDLLGRPKPRLVGSVFNISPPLVNSSLLIYGFNWDADGNLAPCANMSHPRDGGHPFGQGVSRSYEEIIDPATQPAAGTYDYCLTHSLFRLGSRPTFGVTVDAQASQTAAAQVIEAVFLDSSTIVAHDLNAADIQALPQYECGVWVDDDRTRGSVLDALFESVGGWYMPDALGVYRMRQLTQPQGPAVATLRHFTADIVTDEADAAIISLQRETPADEGRGVPAQQVSLSYRPNYTPQDISQLAGVLITTGDEQKFSAPAQTVVARAESVAQQYLAPAFLTFETVLANQEQAQLEAERRLQLYATARDLWALDVHAGPALAAQIQVGAVVKLQIDRFGLKEGKLFVVTQTELNAASGVMSLKIWG